MANLDDYCEGYELMLIDYLTECEYESGYYQGMYLDVERDYQA